MTWDISQTSNRTKSWKKCWKSCCFGCLWCFHGCKCKRLKNKEPRSLIEFIRVFVVLAISILSLMWIYISLILRNDIHNFNEHVFKSNGKWLDWSIVLITVAAVVLTYCSCLLLTSLCLILCGQPVVLHWIHKVLLFICLALITLGFVFLDLKWKEEWQSIYISLQMTGPFLHIGAVIGISTFSWVIAGCYWRANNNVLKNVLLAIFSIFLVGLYITPLFLSSPCIMKPSEIPPKPNIFGHRGAPMLAPENTFMSFDRMAAAGVDVFETDVLVSVDGIPFLMHDDTLKRTTNVMEVFPEQENKNSSNFSWSELEELNAGEWFVQRNPFHTVGSLSDPDIEEANRQKIPRLEDLLKAAAKHNISILFDLREPPEEHPNIWNYTNVTLQTILDSGIHQDLILWLPDEERELVIEKAPGFRQIYGNITVINQNMHYLNLKYTNVPLAEIRSYQSQNISVNLYVINKPWLFSYVWCAGVTSVTTNACHILKDMKHPLWVMDPNYYLVIWIVANCVSFLHIIWAFIIQRKCLLRQESEESGTVLLMRLESLNY
uniref:Glycerophosphodiester phosphodiesterase domain containing 2 n=1 Tax=Leptobrachium leishanense TaxID=445787 RepID=A0A8C5PE19_9ANUR